MHFYHSRLFSSIIFSIAGAMAFVPTAFPDEVYGPINLLKTMPTPFGPPTASPPEDEWRQLSGRKTTNQSDNPHNRLPIVNEITLPRSLPTHPFKSIAVGSGSHSLSSRSLKERLVTSRLYLPGRMILGKPAEFTIKGRPGCHVAVAVADKNTGAKSIYGHNLSLGADRKVIAVGQIPPSGVLTMSIETPIQGDLIGQYLFFEAALWTESDFSDLELATPVTSEGQEGIHNGVQIKNESEQKKGFKFVPDAAIPLQQRERPAGSTLDSGRL